MRSLLLLLLLLLLLASNVRARGVEDAKWEQTFGGAEGVRHVNGSTHSKVGRAAQGHYGLDVCTLNGRRNKLTSIVAVPRC